MRTNRHKDGTTKSYPIESLNVPEGTGALVRRLAEERKTSAYQLAGEIIRQWAETHEAELLDTQ
jgi:hypothetical protein